MHRRTWCTKEDVLKDLEAVSGGRVVDVDEDFFVVGAQPPPSRVFEHEDDEIELRFGRAATSQKINANVEAGPDLKGITKMLRMVHDYENASDEDTVKAAVAPTNKNNVIIISKLNPNVKEFVPKSVQINSSQNGTKTHGETINHEISSSKSSISTNESKSTNTNNSSNENTKSVKKVNEFDEMAALLKSKISAKKNTFEEKHITNSAIVNLLKLYAKPETKAAEPAKALKLYPPEFFETCKASDFKGNEIDNDFKIDGSIEHKLASIPSVEEVKTVDVSYENRDRSSKNVDVVDTRNGLIINNNDLLNNENNIIEDLAQATSLTPDMAEANIADHNNVSVLIEKPDDPEIEESISKVNNWFDNKPYVNKEKPKSPVVYLGPVAYKRKDPVTCKSPSEIADKKISKQSFCDYKPSEYANELHEKYKQKNQKKAPVLNIWEKLEEDLKRKDKEIKDKNKPNA